MVVISHYHRPDSIEAALELLAMDGAAPLGGGTVLGHEAGPHTVVDLQALGLDQIEATEAHVAVGAMVRLRDLIENPATPTAVAAAARCEGPNTLRNAATIGGVVACRDWQSELLAALLVHEAVLDVQGGAGRKQVALETFLTEPPSPALITEIRLARGGTAAAARTGRTPADEAIVSAVGRRDASGIIRLAMSGVAAVPVFIDYDRIDELQPPGDFRGSPQYRRELARILGQRVLDEIG